MKIIFYCIFLLLVLGCKVQPQNKTNIPDTNKPADKTNKQIAFVKKYPVFNSTIISVKGKRKLSWADSILANLTIDQKVGQLFMVAAYSNKDKAHKEFVSNLISQYNIGGLIWMQGGPVRQINLLNYYQSISKIPLINSIDGEWGLAMRLDSTPRFPKQMTLGALQNDSLIYAMGQEIAWQCKRVGLQINFAPVVDINNNPKNPVISNRSFGESKNLVAEKSLQYMLGMQDNKVLACAKHFPGHGDTDSDSHLTLPVVTASKSRIDSLELFPFKKLMDNGLASVMVAHLFIPALDTTKNSASTLSTKIVKNLLREELKFDGLVFTDALNMKGVANYFTPGEVDLKALLAGNDVLLFAEDVGKAVAKIKQALANGLITEKEIDEHVIKILRAKEWSGVNKFKPIKVDNVYEDLNNAKSKSIINNIIKQSITLLKNVDNVLPIQNLDTLSIASVAINVNQPNKFQNRINDYIRNANHFTLKNNFSQMEMDSLLYNLKSYNTIVIGLFDMTNKPESNFGITEKINFFLSNLPTNANVIFNVYGNAYSLAYLANLEKVKAILLSYQDTEPTQDISAQVIMGAIVTKGKLPVNVNTNFIFGQGLLSQNLNRLKYANPFDLNINEMYLEKIDSIANKIISNGTTPGCQILAMKDGQVFYNKSFGYHTYSKEKKVSNTHLYDLASLTKILGSLPILMQMHTNGILRLDNKLSDFSKKYIGNKGNITLREILAHQSGLPAWIPFYLDFKNNKNSYSNMAIGNYNVPVANNLFFANNFVDSIYFKIYNSTVNSNPKYVYSDLGYYLIKKVIEDYKFLKYDNYLETNFYKPLGLSNLTYNPTTKFKLDNIVPTENDTAWRKQLVHGYVHDQGAALLGGIAGHAGLFGNAIDVAVLMQLYLNKGNYAGHNYFSSYTFNEFNKVQYPLNNNRRAAGFDKPDFANSNGPCTYLASAESFGHSGFTGTYTWADPKNNLVYVFLSNRINPTSENKKLINDNVRTKIHEYFYKSLETK